MPVTKRDAHKVLAAILRTFPTYVCEGHESPNGADMGATVTCDGMCMWDTAVKTRVSKAGAEMDATPTLTDHTHEGLSRGSWSIFWEGDAPEDWTSSEELAANIRKATGGRVHVEAINNCILGVHSA
jgi:hypothetical protein